MEMAAAPRRTEPAGSKRPVLVVDDDPLIRRGIQRVLEHEGFVVETAADGSEAVARAAQRPPALVVLDMILPTVGAVGGSGVADALRAAHGDDLPIILITADGQAAEKARQIGAVSYLRKPFEVDALVTAVRAILDSS